MIENNIRNNKIKKYINNCNFDNLIIRLVFEHNIDYRELCYLNGYEPYPNNKLNLIFNYVLKYGEFFKKDKKLDIIFSNKTYFFKNYYFQFFENKSFSHRIYNSEDMRMLLQI